MPDPDPVVADPGPTAAPDPALAHELLPLAELFPACFDRERPRPLKIGIHMDLLAAGFGEAEVKPAEVKRALRRYCRRPRYWKALRAGAVRIDLRGQPAGAVTAAEAVAARAAFAAWKARRASLAAPPRPGDVPSSRDAPPPDATPVPEENLAPGRLELAAKFSELPGSRPVQGGVEIGVPTGEGTVTAILPATVWRKLEQAAKDYPQWVAVLSGSLARFAEGEIALQHPTVQVFERKARPESGPARAVEAAPTTPKPAATSTPKPTATPEPPEAKAAEAKAPEAPAPNPSIVRVAASRKGQGKP